MELIAFEQVFSLVEWEIANFPRKWLHSLTNLVPGFKPSREERLELIDEYLQTVRAAGSEELTGALLDRLTHHVHILEMNGESYRLKQSRLAAAALTSD